MIEGFTKTVIRCNGVDLAVHRAGQGRPLLLIHGFPQNHMCWESVAPQLARRHDVIIPDLRGYGESSAPANDPGNTTYSKRTMAQDMADLLTALDISRADVLGHDRGARVAYRFAGSSRAAGQAGHHRNCADRRFLGQLDGRSGHGRLSLDVSGPTRPPAGADDRGGSCGLCGVDLGAMDAGQKP